MPEVLVEPALYVFGEQPADDGTREAFVAFHRMFARLAALADLNDLRLLVSGEVFSRTSDLFPYAVLTFHEQRRLGAAEDLGTALQQLLDRRGVLHEYSGLEEDVVEMRPLADEVGGVYQDEDLWMAWKDLMASAMPKNVSDVLIATMPPLTFLHESASNFTLALAAAEHTLPVCGLGASVEHPHMLDPGPYQALAEDAPARRDIDIDYEKTGHTMHRPLMRLLEGTAEECSWFITRMCTTRRERRLTPCRIRLHPGDIANPREDQLEFVVCDNQETWVGVFTTTATNLAQLRVAQRLVQRVFKRRCAKAGFQYREVE